MLAGLRLGPGPRIRKLQLEAFPDLAVLQKQLCDLTLAPPGARIDFSWPVGLESYVLTASHNQTTSKIDWKLYGSGGQRSNLLWEHQTNDVTLVYNLVLSEMGEDSRLVIGDGKLSTVHGKLATAEVNSGNYVICPQTPTITELASHAVVDSFDLEQARQLTKTLCVQDAEIFSYPVFLLLFDQEYCRALDHGSRFSLVLFKIEADCFSSRRSEHSDQLAIYDCLKQIKAWQRRTDILAQYDGDRFAILLPETDAKGAKLFTQKIERTLFRNALIRGDGNFIKIKFGIASLLNGKTAAWSILQAAERALLTSQTSEEATVVAQPIANITGGAKRIELDQPIRSLMQIAAAPTGIYTYPAFLLLLEREYHRASRHGEHLFVLQLRLKKNQIVAGDRADAAYAAANSNFLERLIQTKQEGDMLTISPGRTFTMMRRGASVGCLKNVASGLARCLGTDRLVPSDYEAGKLELLARVGQVMKNQAAKDALALVAVD